MRSSRYLCTRTNDRYTVQRVIRADAVRWRGLIQDFGRKEAQWIV